MKVINSLPYFLWGANEERRYSRQIIPILVAYILYLSFSLNGSSLASPFVITGVIMALLIITLCIVSLIFGRKISAPQQLQLPPCPPQPVSQTIQEKILELKRQKELGLISEQQCGDMITQIINRAANR